MVKDSSCRPAFDSIAKSINGEYKSTIRRFTFDRKNLNSNVSPKEKEVLEAYIYSREHKIPISANYQKDGDKEFIFNKALTLSQKQCISCHGNMKNQFLRGQPGDTIGIWSARYSKKMVIMSFVD